MNKVRLSRPLVDALVQLETVHQGIAWCADMELDHMVYANWASLRYFGLIEPVYGDGGSRRRGRWQITALGRDFVAGRARVPSWAWREGGDQVRVPDDDPPMKLITDFLPDRVIHPDPVTSIW